MKEFHKYPLFYEEEVKLLVALMEVICKLTTDWELANPSIVTTDKNFSYIVEKSVQISNFLLKDELKKWVIYFLKQKLDGTNNKIEVILVTIFKSVLPSLVIHYAKQNEELLELIKVIMEIKLTQEESQ